VAGQLGVIRTLLLKGRHIVASDSKTKFKFNLLGGSFWFIAWLFTVGFVNLTFWQAVLAIVAWPYFLGVHFR
jgi:hypothetical protein